MGCYSLLAQKKNMMVIFKTKKIKYADESYFKYFLKTMKERKKKKVFFFLGVGL